MSFSAHHRKRLLEEMQAEPLDLLVIGGGITGAGIAWDAASRGLSVGLVEKGGLRWRHQQWLDQIDSRRVALCEQLEIQLVKEVGRERALLYERAPHLVLARPMMPSIYKGGTYGKLTSSIGLWLYDRLAG